MSTDTNNLVNACNSFHSMWSVPFQVKLNNINVLCINNIINKLIINIMHFNLTNLPIL